MHAEDLKKLNEHFSTRYLGAVMSTRSTSCSPYDSSSTRRAWPGHDRRGAKDFIGEMLQAFPDLDFAIDIQIAEADTVATVGTMSGTHQGGLPWRTATGRRVAVQVMDTARARDGRFCDHWG